VSLIQKTRKADGAPPAAALAGHTRDVSSDGLSIVVPAIHIDGHHLVGEGRSLLIELEITGTLVLLNVTPVRYERLEEEETDSGYLIGLHINDIGSEGLAAYHDYVEGLKE